MKVKEGGKNIQAGVGAGKPEESLLPAVGGSRWRGELISLRRR